MPAINHSNRRPKELTRSEKLELCRQITRRLRAIIHHRKQGLKSVSIEREERASIRRVLN